MLLYARSFSVGKRNAELLFNGFTLDTTSLRSTMNEIVDSLAKNALDLSIKDQLPVPIDYADVGRKVIVKARSQSVLKVVTESLQKALSQM